MAKNKLGLKDSWFKTALKVLVLFILVMMRLTRVSPMMRLFWV